jgi:hypothetical protein
MECVKKGEFALLTRFGRTALRVKIPTLPVLRQLGVFREPRGVPGQITILARHPATIARVVARRILGSRSASENAVNPDPVRMGRVRVLDT